MLGRPPVRPFRFRLGFVKDTGEETFSFNVWSSGLWVSTATGSSAVMAAAGGIIMDPHSPKLQYMVREHLVEAGGEHLKKEGHGMLEPGHTLHLRWNSQHGCIYVDGSHLRHNLELGDEVSFSTEAPPIYLFEQVRAIQSAGEENNESK